MTPVSQTIRQHVVYMEGHSTSWRHGLVVSDNSHPEVQGSSPISRVMGSGQEGDLDPGALLTLAGLEMPRHSEIQAILGTPQAEAITQSLDTISIHRVVLGEIICCMLVIVKVSFIVSNFPNEKYFILIIFRALAVALDTLSLSHTMSFLLCLTHSLSHSVSHSLSRTLSFSLLRAHTLSLSLSHSLSVSVSRTHHLSSRFLAVSGAERSPTRPSGGWQVKVSKLFPPVVSL